MDWRVLVLGNAILVALSVLALRYIARQPKLANSSFAAGAILFAPLLLIGLISWPFLNDVQTSDFIKYLPWFIGGGLAFTFTNVFTYKLLTHLDAAISGVLSTISVIFTIALASVFLNEELSSVQLIGTASLLLSITYILLIAKEPSKHHKSPKSWLYGLIFAVLAGISYSVANVNEKYLLEHMSGQTYMVFGWTLQALWALVLAVLIQPDKFKPLIKNRTNISLLGAAGLSRALAGIMFIYALISSNNVALVVVLNQFKLVAIVLLAAWLLNERHLLMKKILAATAAMISMGIIFWK